MDKILISSCLMGNPVRYDGGDKLIDHPLLKRWHAEGRLVPVCPEIAGGLPTPRAPAEIIGGRNGREVLSGNSQIIDQSGADVTAPFLKGAELGLQIARQANCKFALLTEGSPSCGSDWIYDGSFSGNKIDGMGVFTALLRQNGIKVFNQHQVEELDGLLS